MKKLNRGDILKVREPFQTLPRNNPVNRSVIMDKGEMVEVRFYGQYSNTVIFRTIDNHYFEVHHTILAESCDFHGTTEPGQLASLKLILEQRSYRSA